MKLNISIMFLFAFLCMNSALQAEDSIGKGKNDAEYREFIKKQANAMDTDICFYGIVKDQNDQPVVEAKIVFDMHYFSLKDQYFDGSRIVVAVTDKGGNFLLNGLKGSGLFIKEIEKEGYEYTRKDNSNRSFDYGAIHGDKKFKPDPNNPVVFILHKKPEPGYVEKKHASKSIYLTGEEFEIDFKKGISASVRKLKATTGDMTVSIMPGLSKDRYNVAIATRKDDDLIIEKEGEAHTAPENGAYKHAIAFELKPNEEIEKNIYFKSRRDNIYAYARVQLKLKIKSSSISCYVTLYTSADGGQNFEYDERYTYKRKIQDVSKKIDHDPTNAQLYAERAELKRYILEEEAAFQDIKKAIQLAPRDEKILRQKEHLEKELEVIRINRPKKLY